MSLGYTGILSLNCHRKRDSAFQNPLLHGIVVLAIRPINRDLAGAFGRRRI